MAEAIVRHLDNQRPNGKERPRQETPFRPMPMERGPRKQGGERSQWVVGRVVVNRWPGTVPRLSASDVVGRGHMRKDCHVKMESANLVVGYASTGPSTREVCVDGRAVLTLLDTGCTKLLIHPRCMDHKNCLGGRFPLDLQVLREFGFRSQGSFWRLRTKPMRWP